MVKRYLSLRPLDDALTIMKSSFPAPRAVEVIPLVHTVGRVTAEPLYARYAVPVAHTSSMDGYAVQSRDTEGARDTRSLKIFDFARINTGEALPDRYNAVVAVEDVWADEGGFEIRKAAVPLQNVHTRGSDVKSGQLIIPRGHQIRPFDVGTLAAYGYTELAVRSVRIGVIATGNELVTPGTVPGPGQVVENNTLVTAAYLAGMGATCKNYGIIPDDPESIRNALQDAAAENDLVVISAGMSVGRCDCTVDVIAMLGEVLVHGVAMLPGKLALIGRIAGKPVIGLPGYPLAAQAVLREFAARLLGWWGLVPYPEHTISARIAQKVGSELGSEEFVPVSVANVHGRYWAFPRSRGMNMQVATMRSNGYVRIPAEKEGYPTGRELPIHLTVSPHLIEKAFLLAGTTGPEIDLLADLLVDADILLQCCTVGNMGAALALRSNTCHAAAMMMIWQGLPGEELILRPLSGLNLVRIHLNGQELGLASHGEDLDFTTARIINQPRGTAARILLDAFIHHQGLDPLTVTGYHHQVKSHDAVAGEVASGSADAGICTSTAAEAAGLAFSPLGCESCDLVLRKEYADDERVMDIIKIIRSSEYISRLGHSAAHSLEKIGEIIDILPDRAASPAFASPLRPGV